ncbi:hypothetical protein CEUSTIGMA_g12276.t1 [Chlamydomonas eustigma]|uniref:Methyltransferase type 11 domain-containing protein n=1 Tax=Chlamydomonas eustigma TaxID=1157962 RepID=A0A250XP43_9CHLO|nr:hypothetical protein CEUSTIGMA_g12276.t1 [Chlamydomonas eustigma]|eukprot:GAX84855.1 hypothetical protein CEUSTIGMA_g12276.t1 [Chlamydomonas eustigma]
MPPVVFYAEASYWEERYKKQVSCDFDWFYGFNALKTLLRTTLSNKKTCLHIGCGNSNVQEGMAMEHYKVLNIDISPYLIENMIKRHQHLPNLSYQVADVTSMPELPDCYFGSALDKGTLDALLCHIECEKMVDAMLSEVFRVLQYGGKFLLITLGDPAHRLKYLLKDKYQWAVQVYLLRRVPEAELLKVEGRQTPLNDTAEPITPLGPFSVNKDSLTVDFADHAEHVKHGAYFYAYLCKKKGLVLPTTKAQVVKLPDNWRVATRETVERLQQELGLSPHVLTRGRRTNQVMIPRRTCPQFLFDQREASFLMRNAMPAHTRSLEEAKDEKGSSAQEGLDNHCRLDPFPVGARLMTGQQDTLDSEHEVPEELQEADRDEPSSSLGPLRTAPAHLNNDQQYHVKDNEVSVAEKLAHESYMVCSGNSHDSKEEDKHPEHDAATSLLHKCDIAES